MSITTFNQTGSPLQILETSLAPNSSTSISLDSSRQLVIDGITVQLGNFERGFIEKERFWIYQEVSSGDFGRLEGWNLIDFDTVDGSSGHFDRIGRSRTFELGF